MEIEKKYLLYLLEYYIIPKKFVNNKSESLLIMVLNNHEINLNNNDKINLDSIIIKLISKRYNINAQNKKIIQH